MEWIAGSQPRVRYATWAVLYITFSVETVIGYPYVDSRHKPKTPLPATLPHRDKLRGYDDSHG